MSSVILSRLATTDRLRLYTFLAQYDKNLAIKAVEKIANEILSLGQNPFKGSPLPGRMYMRKLVISFGASGYLVFHKYNPHTDTVQVSRILHQKENYSIQTIGLDVEQTEGW